MGDPIEATSVMKHANALYSHIISNAAFMKHTDMIQSINSLHMLLVEARSIEIQLVELYNTCKRILRDRCTCIDVDPFVAKACNENLCEAAPDVHIPTIVVDTAADVPNAPIYWVKDEAKFAIRIGGVLCCGDIGEIYTKHTKRETIEHVRECKYKNLCKKSYCKYHHPREKQNFITSQWLYTERGLDSKNEMLRHTGRRSTLREDIAHLRGNSEYECRKAQLIHDILVLRAIELYKI